MATWVCVRKCTLNNHLYAPGDRLTVPPGASAAHFKQLDGTTQAAEDAKKLADEIAAAEKIPVRSAKQEARIAKAQENAKKKDKDILK